MNLHAEGLLFFPKLLGSQFVSHINIIYFSISHGNFESVDYLIFSVSLNFLKSLDVGVTGSKSSSEEKTEFLPIFRSGSCAERGPKQYMEDEHVCIDDLIQHMGPASTIPLPGAFYGVRIFCFCLPGFIIYTLAIMIKPDILVNTRLYVLLGCICSLPSKSQCSSESWVLQSNLSQLLYY